MASDSRSKQMRLKVYYTFDQHQTTCLARSSTVYDVTVLPDPEHPDTLLGLLDLRYCLSAVASASPELVAHADSDYAVYSKDCSERDGPLVGHGLLSWGLSSPNSGDKQTVCGKVTTSTLFTGLEVTLKLSQVPGTSQTRFMRSMQLYGRLSALLPGVFDPSAWTAFIASNQAVIALLAQPAYTKPDTKDPDFDAFFGLPALPDLAPVPKRPRPRSNVSANSRKQRQPLDDMNTSAVNALQPPPPPPPKQQPRPRKPRQNTRPLTTALPQRQNLLRATATPTSPPSSVGSMTSPYIDSPALASSPPVFAGAASAIHAIPKTWTGEIEMSPDTAAFDALMSSALNLDDAAFMDTPGLESEFVREFYRFDDGSTDVVEPGEVDATGEIDTVTDENDKSSSVSTDGFDELMQTPKPSPITSPTELPTNSNSSSISNGSSSSKQEPEKYKTKQRPKDRIHTSLVQDLALGRVPRYCENCGNIKTSTWRKVKVPDAEKTLIEKVLCNPCGLYYTARKVMRPAKFWRDESGVSSDAVMMSDAVEHENVTDECVTPRPGDVDTPSKKRKVDDMLIAATTTTTTTISTTTMTESTEENRAE
ncbi:hypothetical protein V1512DRAFT_265337 [Lipomyces arxii]|uniref:uncharacterized protein n=1 Tax=Lipomyces arxii TaxID=56418 RepID=UPI0034CD39B0